MSDWIQSCTNLARHRKTRRLAEILGISRPLAVGYITCFWHRVMEESPEGDLSLWRPEDVADAAMYDGNAEQFHAALIESGFLEVDGRGQRPHDWEDYRKSRHHRVVRRVRKYRSEMRRLWENMARAIRPLIFARDGYRCVQCGSNDRLEVDHTIPLFRGGTNERTNLRTLCRPCNRRKGASA